MMPAPIEVGEVRDLDLVLCSQRHSDHTDPGSLATLVENNSRCQFVVPRAELPSATAIGLHKSRLIFVNDGDTIRVTFHVSRFRSSPPMSDAIAIHVIPTAHETLKVNDRGEHHFLRLHSEAGWPHVLPLRRLRCV